MDLAMIVSALVAIAALVIGIFLGKAIFAKNTEQRIQEAEQQALKITEDAKIQGETIKEKRILEAKEKFLQLKAEHEKEVALRSQKVTDAENRIRQKEQSLNDKTQVLQKQINENNQQKANLEKELEKTQSKRAELDIKRQELEKQQEQAIKQLEKVANLTAEEAKAQLMESMKEEARTGAMAHLQEIVEEAKINASKEAKKIVIQSIQRVAAEQTIENAITVFNLESDEIKGQIIGREGRNIRALEAATGVDLIIDDTPEAIVLSCFDPLRREVARLSLQRLVQDGRIHPARIEEVVEKTKKQIEDQIMEIGERTIIELGVHGLHKDLVRMVGKMRFRSSYGQNLLMHSKETANLCGVMAAELGLGQKVVKLAKRAGLLHDIGKVPDEETELSHALLGARLAEKAGEHPAIINAIGAHHDEMEMAYIISPIVQACDAISGARPGARREIMQSYLQRIKDLENLATAYNGVEKAYAIQAGRELRVIVEADKVTDAESDTLSYEIADKIQKEMQYPGQIKVTVIREKRAVNVAR
ncbi:MAG: ribonuclease Y [Edaphocola sp.]